MLKSKAFKEKERQKQREEEAAASRKKERPSSSSAREEQSSRDDDGEISRVCVAKIFIGTFQSFLAPSMSDDTLIFDSSLSLFSSSNSTLCFCNL